MTSPIYLDHNATTPPHPEVVAATLESLRSLHGNASSAHVYGRAAKQAVDQARAQVAELIGASPHEILFTSGGTESSNLALFGAAAGLQVTGRVVTTAVEHAATLLPCRRLAEQGWQLDVLSVDGQGRALLPQLLPSDTRLVSMMHANNETGAVQPVARFSSLARAVGALVHVDAAQSVGKLPVKVDDLGADLMSVASHKLYGPKGVGALYVREGVKVEPVLLGAPHEGGRRPGTTNVPGVVGFGVACAIAARDLEEEARRLRGLCARLWGRLREKIPGVALNGPPSDRLPNTINISFPGVTSAALLAACPEIAASTGAACHDGVTAPSSVLTAMGLSRERALGAVRFSLGRSTTLALIDRATEELIRAWNQLIWQG